MIVLRIKNNKFIKLIDNSGKNIFIGNRINISRTAILSALLSIIFYCGLSGQTNIQANLDYNQDKKNIPGIISNMGNTFGIYKTLPENNTATIKQFGYNNEAYIDQVKNSGGYGNIGAIIQSLENNQAIINQIGTGNNNLIEQNGANNTALVDVKGDYNNSVFIQDGINNFITQALNTSNKNYYFTQQGENNLILQQENDVKSKPYMISQKGNGMHLIITNTHY